MASRFQNKIRQFLYKPGKSKFLNKDTFRSVEDIEKVLDKSISALTGKKNDKDEDKTGDKDKGKDKD